MFLFTSNVRQSCSDFLVNPIIAANRLTTVFRNPQRFIALIIPLIIPLRGFTFHAKCLSHTNDSTVIPDRGLEFPVSPKTRQKSEQRVDEKIAVDNTIT